MNTNRVEQAPSGRRQFLSTASTAGLALAGVATAIAGCATSTAARGAPTTSGEHEHEHEHEHEDGEKAEEGEVTPGEDLMQEHGILERILLIYDEGARRIERAEPIDLAVLASAGGIVQRFVESYHEKLEEEFVFPRLQAAGREAELVTVLLRQHQRGREVTDDIVRRAGTTPTPELAQALRAFAAMYRPHAAREDTVLFPAFREVVGRSGYRELGEQFEDEEHRRFGDHGFENTVAEVARLEAAFGIGDLARFTP